MADLFDWAKGVKARDEGAMLAATAQEDEDPGWHANAYAAILKLARQKGELHTDDVNDAVAPPSHYNAWGAVWLRAIRDGVIERTGAYQQTKDPKKHAHVYPVYRSLLFKVPA